MEEFDKQLYRLSTIASIGRGQRVSTTHEFIKIETPSVFQGLSRWFVGDSRERACQYISREINSTAHTTLLLCELYHATRKESTANMLKQTNSALIKAKAGIQNLLYTYATDNNCAYILEELDKKIEELLVKITDVLDPNFQAH